MTIGTTALTPDASIDSRTEAGASASQKRSTAASAAVRVSSLVIPDSLMSFAGLPISCESSGTVLSSGRGRFCVTLPVVLSVVCIASIDPVPTFCGPTFGVAPENRDCSVVLGPLLSPCVVV